MGLVLLEEKIKEIQIKQKSMEFCDIIREAREAIGLKQSRASELIGMGVTRLKNLETGYFRGEPDEAEIRGLSCLYDLDACNLANKAEEYCESRKPRTRRKKYA